MTIDQSLIENVHLSFVFSKDMLHRPESNYSTITATNQQAALLKIYNPMTNSDQAHEPRHLYLNRSIPAVRDGHNPGAVRVAPPHGEVRSSKRGGHDDACFPDGDGRVGDVEAVEHDPGGGHADAADERDAHGSLDVRHAQGRERLCGVGHEQVLGEVEARLGDDGGDVR